jgi:4-amino-4-deoxy-L-arabinose transferase-like glycosyltransferase
MPPDASESPTPASEGHSAAITPPATASPAPDQAEGGSERDRERDDPDGELLPPGDLPILAFDLLPVPPRPKTRVPEWLVRFGVLLAACGLYLPNIGSFGLWDPWETHYGEVTRYMIETGDWVHPWWGYKGEKIGTEDGPGEQFHSKPILLFWMEAATIEAIGLSETAVRFPVALIAIVGLMASYYALSKLLGRRRGLLATLVLATCPLWFFLARQSQTDMPFVGTLTAAMMFFALAVFGPREQTTDRRMWIVLASTFGFITAVFLPQLGIVAADVNKALMPRADQRPPGLFDEWRVTGWMQAVMWLLIFSVVLVSIVAPIMRELKANNGTFSDAFKDGLRRKCYLWLFYTFCGLSLMGKGLLGFMLPGAVIFIYLTLTGEWALLAQRTGHGPRGRLELIRGILIFACVGFPWYTALLSGPDGNAFWTRFFIHDHFNRLGSGVHEIDDGSFEHFVKWLGFGMWPWSALIPVGLIGLAKLRLRQRDTESRLRLFLFLWAFISYILFSLSSTKFHHYIFPALPPLALMVGWGLYDLLSDRTRLARALVVAAVGIAAMIGWDIYNNPQHLRNQFTYKYDREWPSEAQRPLDPDGEVRFEKDVKSDWEPEQTWAQSDFYRHTPESLHGLLATPLFRFNTWIPVVGATVGVGLLLLVFAPAPGRRPWLRGAGVSMVGVAAVGMTFWVLNYYMPMLGPHWSQKYLFDKYYDLCVPARVPAPVADAFTPVIGGSDALMTFFSPRPKRVCEDEVISWLLTWRGETFYSNNTIRPIQKDGQFEPYLKEFNKGQRFFVHIERTRAKSFKGRVESAVKKLQDKPEFKGIKDYTVTLEHNENYWFVLLKAQPNCKDGYENDRLGRCLPRTAEAPPPVRNGAGG